MSSSLIWSGASFRAAAAEESVRLWREQCRRTSVVDQMLCELAFLRLLSLNWNESAEQIERRLPKLLLDFDRQ